MALPSVLPPQVLYTLQEGGTNTLLIPCQTGTILKAPQPLLHEWLVGLAKSTNNQGLLLMKLLHTNDNKCKRDASLQR